MKLQLVLFATLVALVHTSPLPQTLEGIKPVEVPAEPAVEIVPAPEEPVANTNISTPGATESTIDLQTEAPTTTELSADPVPAERFETAEDEANKVEEVRDVQARAASDVVAAVPVNEAETAQVNSDNKDDAVKIADAVEPAAVASDEIARPIRTSDEQEETKETDETQEAVSVTTLATTVEENAVEAKTVATDETSAEVAKPTTEAVGVSTAGPAIASTTASAEMKTEITTAAVVPAVESAAVEPAAVAPAAVVPASAVSASVVPAVVPAATTKPKEDSSEESKESQESDEDKS
ncbi:protein SON-like [Topomyia yanbarensis]|uniref:protein SON-like n=1 Tax=Topomyia yanbarensis TaxID=2498891 RepID=UPI00273C1DE0|nr:protein SON-like [Topomyia yanbarensis]XP_058812924.1 protein SON-like [Topomyia yanbarensis]